MPTLQDSSFSDVLAALDEWTAFSPGSGEMLFIGAVGFEERSPACFENWCVAARGSESRAILIRYPFNVDENAIQEARFAQASRAAGVPVEWLDYRQRSIFGEMIGSLRNHSRVPSVLLDISSLASFALFPVFAAIFDQLSMASIRVCYSEAADYFPKRAEWDEFQAKVIDLDLYERARLFDEHHFQSSGVDIVFECAPFIGHNPDNLPTALLIVPNFSFERVNRMIDFGCERYSVPRDRLEWVIGVPPNRDVNGWRHDALWQMFDQPSRKHEASTLHYKEMLLVLHQIWQERHTTQSLSLATVGSKSQHLAEFLFLTMHPEVSLVLSQPKEFIASKFSEKTGPQWQLDLGSAGELTEKLIGWNKITFQW